MNNYKAIVCENDLNFIKQVCEFLYSCEYSWAKGIALENNIPKFMQNLRVEGIVVSKEFDIFLKNPIKCIYWTDKFNEENTLIFKKYEFEQFKKTILKNLSHWEKVKW